MIIYHYICSKIIVLCSLVQKQAKEEMTGIMTSRGKSEEDGIGSIFLVGDSYEKEEMMRLIRPI